MAVDVVMLVLFIALLAKRDAILAFVHKASDRTGDDIEDGYIRSSFLAFGLCGLFAFFTKLAYDSGFLVPILRWLSLPPKVELGVRQFFRYVVGPLITAGGVVVLLWFRRSKTWLVQFGKRMGFRTEQSNMTVGVLVVAFWLIGAGLAIIIKV